MATTGKKRLTVEFNKGVEEEILLDFKKKCLDVGKSHKVILLVLIRDFVRAGK